ncbi:MAG TPA: ATP-binding protein, partial [Candidatus Monoglobus merdigallinarum]|nr:ATP-binding protein [Candidatus Monoglobus merdigallinarum]
AGTIITLVSANPEIEFRYIHRVNDAEFSFDTAEVKNILGDVPLDSTEVLAWIMDYITEKLNEIRSR